MFKNIALFIIKDHKAVRQVKFDVLAFYSYMDCTCMTASFIRGEVCVYKTSLTPSVFIDLCVTCRDIEFASFYDFSIRFWSYSGTVLLLLVFFLFQY